MSFSADAKLWGLVERKNNFSWTQLEKNKPSHAKCSLIQAIIQKPFVIETPDKWKTFIFKYKMI